ncbi:MAG: hypothetical protein E6H52_19910 [Betaproteobacteria bacterium]|nr:MAG: hypothetical protein E6H52_19910 [Betaproteobacteria bacterium]
MTVSALRARSNACIGDSAGTAGAGFGAGGGGGGGGGGSGAFASGGGGGAGGVGVEQAAASVTSRTKTVRFIVSSFPRKDQAPEISNCTSTLPRVACE